jgi:hypothetical protein
MRVLERQPERLGTSTRWTWFDMRQYPIIATACSARLCFSKSR